MVKIRLGALSVDLNAAGNNIELKSLHHPAVLLTDQTIEDVCLLLSNNFSIVSKHYLEISGKTATKTQVDDIQIVSLHITLHYLYTYNLWRKMYKNQEKRNLAFSGQDSANTSTSDIIFNYFKPKYPDEWQQKCAVLMGMDLDSLLTYYKQRELYYNK